jgi:hypothetical protein
MKRESGMSDTIDREQVLAAYFADERLAALPRHLGQLRIVLETIQERFTPDHVHDAREVDTILAQLTDQVQPVRAALLSLGYLREDNGGYVRGTPRATPARPLPGAQRPGAQDDPARRERDHILRAVFNKQGRLTSWPNKTPVMRVMLEAVQTRFAPDRVYSEQEVNVILREVHDDYCILRRALVDYGYLGRDHGRYWWTEPDPNRPVVID